MAYLIVFPILVALGGISTLFAAYVATIIWAWYLVPAGLPTVALWPMFGALLVFRTVQGVRHPRKDERPPLAQLADVGRHIAAVVIVPVLLLCIAWVGLFFA